ncbi:MAG: tetratricopeptide repeat protein, partial [Deltaproteobacteria bacterium]|nr:tetratricopeptide repeat protein [Deltaproteobacteria bacterium]
ILLPHASLSDLGAPFGQEEKWLKEVYASLRAAIIHDTRLASLKIQEIKDGVKILGIWKFPDGKKTLANPKMEHFDYRDFSPPRYIVDFWLKQGPTLLEVKTKESKMKKIKLQKADIALAKKKEQTRQTLRKQKEELEDIIQFCNLPQDDSNAVFLPFYPVHESVNFKPWFWNNLPDQNYTYPEPNIDGSEQKYVRLALALYKRGNSALALKVIEFLEAEFPSSAYLGETDFLKANALLKVGLKNEAKQVMEQILLHKKDPQATFQTAVFLAANALESNAHLLALEHFLWLIQNYPEHPLVWAFHFAAAESLYALRQIERAAKEYQWVLLNAPTAELRAQSALRIGDLYLLRHEHDRSLAAYYQGLKNFPEEAKKFPSIHINRAESLYWLKDWNRAEAEFKKFLENFPSHPAGWRATFRLGEIYARKVGTEVQSVSRKWFYDTINRYPTSAGSTLAKMKLIPCGDHAGLDFIGIKRFFELEVKDFINITELDLKKFPDFKALTKVRTYVSLGQFSEAVSASIDEMETLKSQSTVKDQVEKVLQSVFRKTVLTLIEDGKKFEALNFYQTNLIFHPEVKNILHGNESDYLYKLSQAASDLELGEVAKDLIKSAQKIDVSIQARTPSSQATEASDILIDEKLKISEKKFTEAKALWILEGFTADKKIRELLSPIIPESSYSHESEIILGLLDEKKSEFNLALMHALKSQLLQGHNVLFHFWIASLYFKTGDFQSALQIVRNIKDGYEYSKALIHIGDDKNLKIAQDKLELLAKSKEESVWRKLASETLANLKAKEGKI